MRTKKLQALGRKATQNLDLDFSRYAVDEAVATIADVMVLPLYVGRVMIIPILGFALAIGAVGLVFFDYYFQLLGYGLLAWVVSLPLAYLIGMLLLLRQIRQDVGTVFRVALDTAGKAYEDMLHLRKNNARGQAIKIGFYQVFKGVAYVVILPSVHKVLERKFKFFGVLVAGIFDRVFVGLMRTRKKDMDKIEDEVLEAETEDEALVRARQRLEKLQNSTQRVISTVMWVNAAPFIVLTLFVGLAVLVGEWLLFLLFF